MSKTKCDFGITGEPPGIVSLKNPCYCCSGVEFEHCCAPLLAKDIPAPNAQSLMRSRYSAFCTNNAEYIWATYGSQQRGSLSVQDVAQSNTLCTWLGLRIVDAQSHDIDKAEVEFCAYYQEQKNIFQLHERSQFEKQEGEWRYTTGKILPDSGAIKVSRNDPCLCQSGKKFKKCCLNKINNA
ncbi:MAG: YchJ family protein [Aestuariibacter sp.]